MLAPVRAGARERLAAALQALGRGDDSPFGRVPGTHFARYVVLDALTGPDGSPVTGAGPFMLMCADFDPAPTAWAAAVCRQAGVALAPVMDCWEGFPGCEDPTAVAKFFARHDVPAGFTVAGYPAATVAEIRQALKLRDGLRAMAIRTGRERLDPAALRSAWSQTVRAAGGPGVTA